MDGLEATKAIKSEHPAVGIVALSMYEEESMVLAMMQAGAKGYLLKNASRREVVHAIQVVNAQGMYYCATASNKMVRLMARTGFQPYEQRERPHFSERDLQIIRLLCQQHCSKEIAAMLDTTCRTVEGARERIQEKMGVRNMAGVIVYAIRHGIFGLD